MENDTDKSAPEILLEAAELLAEEGIWGKGHYFDTDKRSPKGCSMCAHGAIAYCGDPSVKKQISECLTAGRDPRASINASASTQGISNTGMPNRLDIEHITKHFGQTGLAHYKAAQAGLTFGYNDDPATTRQDVINKLREAARL